MSLARRVTSLSIPHLRATRPGYGSGTVSAQRFGHSIYRIRRKVATDVIYFAAALYFNLGHLAIGQTAESGYSFVKPSLPIRTQIASDFTSLRPKLMDSVRKNFTQFCIRRTFDLRPESAHKAPEILYASIPRSLVSVLSGAALSENGKDVRSQRGNYTDQTACDITDQQWRRFAWHSVALVLGTVSGLMAYCLLVFIARLLLRRYSKHDR
jgi:hypothetical protein